MFRRSWDIGRAPCTSSGDGSGKGRRASSGLGALRGPVPSLVNMSSALPALGKHSTRHLRSERDMRRLGQGAGWKHCLC